MTTNNLETLRNTYSADSDGPNDDDICAALELESKGESGEELDEALAELEALWVRYDDSTNADAAAEIHEQEWVVIKAMRAQQLAA